MKLTEDERVKLLEKVRHWGSYEAASREIRKQTGRKVSGADVWRAARLGIVSRKLELALYPPPPRVRYCIECDQEADRDRLAALLVDKTGRRLRAASVIELLERIRE